MDNFSDNITIYNFFLFSQDSSSFCINLLKSQRLNLVIGGKRFGINNHACL